MRDEILEEILTEVKGLKPQIEKVQTEVRKEMDIRFKEQDEKIERRFKEQDERFDDKISKLSEDIAKQFRDVTDLIIKRQNEK